MRRFLMVLCITLIAGAAAVLVAVRTASSDAVEEYHQTVSLLPGTEVNVRNISGAVSISAWDEPIADIYAVKRTSRGPEELQYVSIEVRTNGRLDIETRYDTPPRPRSFLSYLFGRTTRSTNAAVDYTIRIPRSAVVGGVKTVSADISVAGADSRGQLSTTSGGILLDDTRGMSGLETVSGDIRVRNSGIRTVRTVSGDIRLMNTSIGAGSRGVRTTSGNVEIEDAAGAFDIFTTSGDIELANADGAFNIRTVTGDARLRNVRGDIRFEMTGGSIETDGAFLMEAGNGDIRLDGGIVRSVSAVSADILLSPTDFSNSVEMKTISGNIFIAVPQGIDIDLDMWTTSGSLVNCTSGWFVDTSVSRRELSGHIGTRGKRLSIRTTSGDVVLERSTRRTTTP